MSKIKVDAYKCERCGHIWMPRVYSKEESRVCPRCKSPYWNKKRIRKTAKKLVKNEGRKNGNKNW